MIPEAREVWLTPEERVVLEARCRAPTTALREFKRARIVLLAAEGRSTRGIAREVDVEPRVVSTWRHRFADHGLEGLVDKPKPGKLPIYGEAANKRILALLEQPPPKGYARWTGPLLAAALGDVDVQYALALPAHRKDRPFGPQKLVRKQRPRLRSESRRIVGLYLNPPERELVLAVDEKPSIQALERRQGYRNRPMGVR